MRNKILSLAPDEEIQVIGHNCKYSLKIKNSEEELHIEEVDDIKGKSNMTVTTFSFDYLKLYVIFENYYQLIMNQDNLPSDIEDCIKKIMNYHEDKIYGKSGAELDADDYDYQCIAYE